MSSDEWNVRYSGADERHRAAPPTTHAELAGFLAALAERPRVAVDLGCGTGDDVIYLASQGIDATGIDFSSRALEIARERAGALGIDATWIEGDVLDLPLADASVDLVTDHGCLHHVPVADRPRYARDVARVLRPGGVLLVREEHRAPDHAHGQAHAHAHGNAITEDAIRAMVADTPLRVRSTIWFDRAGKHGAGRASLTTLVRE